MKKIAPILFFVFLFSQFASVFSQDFNAPVPKPKKEKTSFPDMDKVYVGGGIGFSFTQYEVLVDLSPAIGYKITDKFSVGIGIVYNYYRNSYFKPQPPLILHIYGGTIFSRYLITDYLFAHAEYQSLNGPWKLLNGCTLPTCDQRFFIHNVWVGGGMRQQMGENSSLMVSALWNVNESIYSYPLSPQIRIGFNIGL